MMNPREQKVMAAILAIGAVWLFGWNALYLFGIGAPIYWIMKHRT